MRYEDMLNDPEQTFGALAHHLLFKPTADELALAIRRSSFESLRDEEDKDGVQEKSKHADRFFANDAPINGRVFSRSSK